MGDQNKPETVIARVCSSVDHDPGDEDPTEDPKRALLELLDDGLPEPSAAAVRERFGLEQVVEVPPARTGHSILSLPWSSSPWPWLV